MRFVISSCLNSGVPVNGARHLAVYVARVEHQDLVAALLVPLLGAVEEPQLARHGSRVEEVAADVDHHVDGPGLDDLLSDGGLVAARARRLGRHDDARTAVLVQVAVEVREPQVVGVRDLLPFVDAWQAEGQALVALDLLGIHLVNVERRVVELAIVVRALLTELREEVFVEAS